MRAPHRDILAVFAPALAGRDESAPICPDGRRAGLSFPTRPHTPNLDLT
jgi:hypothetical protein